jgi:hypothetical protein
MDRQTLKHKVLMAHRRWSPEHKRMIVPCAWCGEDAKDFDAHEYLVKRSGVNPKYHDLIMVPENVAPLHHVCHMKHGQTKEMALRCLHYTARSLGADKIGRWYVSLWQDHGLNVKKGWLLQPHEVPMRQAREMFDKGYALLGPCRVRQGHGDGSITDWSSDSIDMRDCAFAQFVPPSKRKAHHKELAFSAAEKRIKGNQGLVSYARAGYWLDYLEGVLNL